MTKQERQRRAKAAFDERLEAQREARAQEAQRGHQHHSDDEDETPAPARRWERFGAERLRPTTTSITGSDPIQDQLLFDKFGSRIPSAEQVREAERTLHRRLSGQLDDDQKVPLAQRPEEVAHPRCPVDGVPMTTVSYSASMRPAERKCPACGRSEREFTEKGISLESPTEGIHEAMEHGGLHKKPKYSPVEQAVRGLIRRW